MAISRAQTAKQVKNAPGSKEKKWRMGAEFPRLNAGMA